MLLLLVALSALADPQARVDVLGVGNVPLADAEATCATGRPQGEVAAARDQARIPAFQDVARGLLTLTSDDRRAYFRVHHDLDWPTRELDVTYVPPSLSWTHPGVVASCEAAGGYWVREGVRLSQVCSVDKNACRARFAESEAEIVKDALRRARKAAGKRQDPFFAHLSAHDGQLERWTNPLVYLEPACGWPQVAASQSRFVDRDDLLAARRACLQLRALVTHAPEVEPIAQRCETPWRDVTADRPFVVVHPASDLGLTASQAGEQLETIRDRLTRMDPSADRCDGDWAAVWRKQLVQVWREAQATAACKDASLPLADRLHLCPDLPSIASEACDATDPTACRLLGGMYVDGVGQPRDVGRGVLLFLGACRSGHAPSCDALRAQVPAITGWIDERIAAATTADGAATSPAIPVDAHAKLDEARAILETYAPHVGPAWAVDTAQRLFTAALRTRHVELAGAVLTTWGDRMPPDGLATARLALEALAAELATAPSAR